jgi:glycosyltransferase involved in cell wall biosynthesis
MTLSIALCTYNGECYLREQLQSILNQVRPPDELVVFDDASTDHTVGLLHDFAAKQRSFPVRIHVNPRTVGPLMNFQQAIAACRGTIISLCDQDDVWLPDKLARVEAAFEDDPSLGFVFGNAEICDAECRPLGYRLWNSVGFTGRLVRRLERGLAFDVVLRQNVVTGATMAFSARFRPLVLPIGSTWIHDAWIALLISAIAPVVAIREPVMLYRQHPKQHVGALRRSFRQQYRMAKMMKRSQFQHEADRHEAAYERLVYAMNGLQDGGQTYAVSERALALLQEKICHCRRRSAIRRRECSRVLPSMTEFVTLRYRRFSLGWKSFAQDLFL